MLVVKGACLSGKVDSVLVLCSGRHCRMSNNVGCHLYGVGVYICQGGLHIYGI